MKEEPIDVRLSEVMEEVEALEYKYRSLVWWARKPAYEDVDTVYSDSSKEIRDGCKRGIARVEEDYPDDLRNYHECPDFSHGFNSGVLAATRFVLTAMDTTTTKDEDGFEFEIGGLDFAKDTFPQLDT